jgi:hypothetical protein
MSARSAIARLLVADPGDSACLSVGLRGDSGPFDAADRVQQFGCARRRAAEAYHGEQRKLYDNLKLASVLDAPLKRLGHLHCALVGLHQPG